MGYNTQTFERRVELMQTLRDRFRDADPETTTDEAHNTMRNVLKYLPDNELKFLCLSCCKVLTNHETKASKRNMTIYALHDALHDGIVCFDCPMFDEESK